MSILDSAKAQAAEVGRNQATATVGLEGRGVSGSIEYQRTLRNGLGLTAYLKAWWHDASVTPTGGGDATPPSGFRVGIQAKREF